jgi:hypothetical protein
MVDVQSKSSRSRRWGGPVGLVLILLGLCVAGVVLVAASFVLILSIFFKLIIGTFIERFRRSVAFFGPRRTKETRVEDLSAGFGRDDPAAKMDCLEALYRSGEISKAEYEKRRGEVLDAL